ncbi:3'(2'),5'-bisphosphate nucleotidase CysQ [Francisellaceae bacterium]|nr:3'(2'),5'-bisphosphate nucleotidase CysQ [Francisellaceae bacterium]
MKNLNQLLDVALNAANHASEKMLEIYQKDFSIDYKDDKSPLTEADEASHQIIYNLLKDLGYPVISEESKPEELIDSTSQSNRFWLVDPLDGTKEFIKKNGEFTVNIALIENNRPILGVVAIPAQNKTYYAIQGQGAYKVKGGNAQKINCSKTADLSVATIAVSRSHLKQEDQDFIARNNIANTKPLGSALKYCEIADGSVDLSIRFTPLMQWDLAASDIIVHEAGGVVSDFKGCGYQYDPQDSENALVDGLIARNENLVVSI